jgi:hypothetical protein
MRSRGSPRRWASTVSQHCNCDWAQARCRPTGVTPFACVGGICSTSLCLEISIVHRLHGASQRPARSLTALLSHPQSVARECLCGTAESSHPNHGDIRCIHSRCIAAILDSTRNIIILTADEPCLSCLLASANACMRASTWNCKERRRLEATKMSRARCSARDSQLQPERESE